MTDLNNDGPEAGSDPLADRTGMPTWVKVSLLVVIALIAIVVIGNLTGVGGEHGPQRHGGSDSSRTSVVHEDGHRPPAGHGP